MLLCLVWCCVGEWCVGGVLDLQRHAPRQRHHLRPYVAHPDPTHIHTQSCTHHHTITAIAFIHQKYTHRAISIKHQHSRPTDNVHACIIHYTVISPPPSLSAGLATDSPSELSSLFNGVRFGVFGCGNSQWARTYQKIPALLDEALEKAGGRFYVESAGITMYTYIYTYIYIFYMYICTRSELHVQAF